MKKSWMSFDEFSKVHTVNTFRLPKDPKFRSAYEAYKISREIKSLPSEKGRTIFAEDFIEDDRLGTLADLSTKALATGSQAKEKLALLHEDPVNQSLYYQNLSVDLPFEQCHHIVNDDYWRRVVCTKTTGMCEFESVNWKNMAMSLKLKEVMESYPPGLWQSGPLIDVAPLIKQYIVDLAVDKLRPMEERVCKEYLETGDVDVVEEAIYDTSYIFSPRSSSESDYDSEVAEGEYEEMGSLDGDYTSNYSGAKSQEHETPYKSQRSTEDSSYPEVVAVPKKKRKPKFIKSIFDIELSEDEDSTGESDIKDRRNLAKCLANRRLKYPAALSHHIDFRFLRFFDHLSTLSIKFQGVGPSEQAESWKLNVSDLDMERLAYSLRYLTRLKVFRLSSSRLDAGKIYVIAKGLKRLPLLETVDFGYDQLVDDLSNALHELFRNKSLKSLELRGNKFNNGNYNLQQLGKELMTYKGHLDYLGLAFNFLGDDGLNALSSAMVASRQVSHLCLTGVQMSESALIESVARKLVGQHKELQKLEIVGITLSPEASYELLKALQLNMTLKLLDCRGCDMPTADQYEAEVMIRRNRYVEENPQCLDATQWKSQELNPTIVRALASIQRMKQCQLSKPVKYVESEGSSKEVHSESVGDDEDDDNLRTEHFLTYPRDRHISTISTTSARYSQYSADTIDFLETVFATNRSETEDEFISHFRI